MINTITNMACEWASSGRKMKNHQLVFSTGRHWPRAKEKKDEVVVETTDDDLIVISVGIGNNIVRRILIDDDSAVEILSYDVY